MNKRKILVVQQIRHEGTDLIEARDDVEYEILQDPSEAELIAAVKDVHGITVRTTKIPRSVIMAAENLEVVSRHGVGYDAVDVAALTERGIPLTIAVQANAVSVAEQAMMMMLTLSKHTRRFDREIRVRNWAVRNDKTRVPDDLEGKSLLIVGFGRIGKRLAKRAHGFEMNVSVVDPFIDQAEISSAGCTPVAKIDDVLAEVDYVSIHCPRKPDTENLFSTAQFKAMKKSAYLINCARGGLVDEAALHTALTTGEIAAAGLDVFDLEPPEDDNPLLDVENAVFTPHSAGGSHEAMVRSSVGCVQNVLDCFDGTLSPAVVVNREVLKS